MNDSSCLQRPNFSPGTAWQRCATHSKQAAAAVAAGRNNTERRRAGARLRRRRRAPFRPAAADGAVPPGTGGGAGYGERGGSGRPLQLCSVSESAGIGCRAAVRRHCPACHLPPALRPRRLHLQRRRDRVLQRGPGSGRNDTDQEPHGSHTCCSRIGLTGLPKIAY